MNRFVRWLKSPSQDFWLFVVALVLLNAVSYRAYVRKDLTAAKSYSLSESSKVLVGTLQRPMLVQSFFSDNLPSQYESVRQYASDIMGEYASAANAQFTYEDVDLSKQKGEDLARSYGIQQVRIQELKSNEVGVKSVYMSLVISYADQQEVLYVDSADGLEYKVTSAMNAVIARSATLASLAGKVGVTLYQTRALGTFGFAGFDQVEQAVRSAYAEVFADAGDRASLEVIDADSAQAREAASRYGVQLIRYEDASGGQSYGALGLVLSYGDTFSLVPLEVRNMIFSYMVAGLDTLSDNMQAAMASLMSRTSEVGYVTGHGELDFSDSASGSANFYGLLSDTYTLRSLNLAEEDIPVGMKSLVIDGANQPFAESELYKIDQFIMRGGNVLFFVDPCTTQDGSLYEPNQTGLERLLSSYGIEVKDGLVLDEKCYSQLDAQYGRIQFYYAPVADAGQLAKKHPVTQNLSRVLFLQTGALDATAAMQNDALTVTPLVRTSGASWMEPSGTMNLNPLYMSVPSDRSSLTTETLALVAEGRFDSAFDADPSSGGDAAVDASSFVGHGIKSARVFVAATSAITSPLLIEENSTQPVALFVRNAVDYANENDDLCLMRTKGLGLAVLDVTSGTAVTVAKYAGQVGIPLVVLVAALVVLLVRRAHRKAIEQAYGKRPEEA